MGTGGRRDLVRGTWIDRRDFLKYTGLGAAAGLLPGRALAGPQLGRNFQQQIRGASLYMTHYALFEEPDPKVPAAVYIDAQTGQPTTELQLAAPLSQRCFTRGRGDDGDYAAPADTSKLLPYVVSPPGFPALAVPDAVVGAVQAITQLPAPLVAVNTTVLLVAIGQFLGEGTCEAELREDELSVRKTVHFEVRIRTGFLFQPPQGVPAPAVGVLVGYLNFGLLHQLIGLPPGTNAGDLVVYSWKADMTLSTRQRFVRSVATEPPPVADAFPAGLAEIRFQGSRVDRHGNYTLVGHAKPADVQFIAPPELELFLFQTSSLADVEFAVLETGVLSPAEGC